MKVLGIESSCDETAAAVVEDGKIVHSNAILSQIAQHQPFGGVVPEIASRAHLEAIQPIISQALEDANCSLEEIDRIAVTHGPGLASSLLIGVSAAKGLALTSGIPLLGINHLEGHIASVFLGEQAPTPEDACPMVMLMVSGGHSCLMYVKQWGEYELLGRSIDDAAGEALDKGAKLLGLGYPGGPEVEKMALGGNPKAIHFPRGLKGAHGETEDGLEKKYCFSFSGLKTALLYHLKKCPEVLPEQQMRDICASYQQAVIDSLVSPLSKAVDALDIRSIACVGGVAKNQKLRAELDRMTAQKGIPLHITEMAYCTDNAAMIAAVGCRENSLTETGSFDVNPSLRIT